MSAPRIRTLLLADSAQAIDGKLYILGGGFAAMAVRDFASVQRCALAAILDIPAGFDGGPIPISAHLENLHGRRLAGWQLSGELTPDPGEGTAVLAGDVEITVDGPAELQLSFTFGEDSQRIPFRVAAAG